jgi:putative YhbY family RNA-binding protein
VVLLGTAGLTEAVLKETDRALAAHELIKVRIPGDDRAQREAVCAELAGRLGAARIQAIGKLLVLYRPKPEETAPAKRPPVRPKPPTAPAAGRPGRPAPPARDLRRRIGGRGR